MWNGRAIRAVFSLAGAALLSAPTHLTAQVSKAAGRASTLQAIEVDDPGGQVLSFRHLSGSTVVELRGTKIEPGANTRMKVGSRPGFTELDINRGEIKGLQPARRFGRDFYTYVLWAVSVDGEASNLGEVTFDQFGPVSINVTTPYQTFWLMITAEPDYAVNDPSPVVVMYSVNQDAVETTSKALPIAGKLIYYTYYSKYDTTPGAVERGVPNEILQARKAVELASASGILATPTPAGQELLPDELRTRQTLAQARQYLKEAEDTLSKGDTREAAQFARTAIQIAENARALSLGAVGGLHVRQLERDVDKLRAEVEKLRTDAEKFRADAERSRADAERWRVSGEEATAQLAALRDRVRELETALERERGAGLQAGGRASAAEQQLQALQRQLGQLEQALQQAGVQNDRLRSEREKICGELRRQLSSLGQLTQQGGNMMLTLASDILFDFNSYELRPTARENLAKLAVLRLLLFPQAQVRYVGHTDRVGDDDYNQWLSEQRALAVYRYFLEESLGHASAAAARDADAVRLTAVQQLLGNNYAGARQRPTTRQEQIVRLGDNVVGMGERDPVEETQGPSERNRRVVLLFPPAQMGQMTSICEAPSSQALTSRP